MTVVNAGLDDELFANLRKSIQEAPFNKLLGIEAQLLAPGYAEIKVLVRHDHTNPIGLIQGGLVVIIADAAMGNAIRGLGMTAVTVDLSNSFTAGARLGETLVAKGKVVKAGKTMIFAEALVYANDNLVGHSKATFYRVSD